LKKKIGSDVLYPTIPGIIHGFRKHFNWVVDFLIELKNRLSIAFLRWNSTIFILILLIKTAIVASWLVVIPDTMQVGGWNGMDI
jgi:hypothetical protein